MFPTDGCIKRTYWTISQEDDIKNSNFCIYEQIVGRFAETLFSEFYCKTCTGYRNTICCKVNEANTRTVTAINSMNPH